MYTIQGMDYPVKRRYVCNIKSQSFYTDIFRSAVKKLNQKIKKCQEKSNTVNCLFIQVTISLKRLYFLRNWSDN